MIRPLHPMLLMLVPLVFLAACEPAHTTEDGNRPALNGDLTIRAKHATAKYKLSEVKPECIQYNVAKERFQDLPTVNAHEVHNEDCGGDPSTSPRLFTLAFDDTKGIVWSDAKSLVGHMEIENISSLAP